MQPIVTVTFSPCIDKSTSVPRLLPEKKLKCAYPMLEPGGGGVNVARAIKKLGGNAIAVFPAGGYTGKYFVDLLDKEKVNSRVIESENETRENIIVYDEASRLQYRFGMPASPLNENEWNKVVEAVEGCGDVKYIVASGSLPPGVPADIFARLSMIAKKKNAKFIVDSSGEALALAVNAGVYLLKPNLAELSMLTGKEYLEEHEIAPAAKQLVESNKCEVVVVSMGKEGALLVTKDKEIRITAPAVEQKSTVGAGDSMVAGIVFSLYRDDELETAVQFGVACGTAATMNAATGLCRLEDVQQLFCKIKKAEEEKIY